MFQYYEILVFQTRDVIIQVIIKYIIVIKAALKRSRDLTNTPAVYYVEETSG